MNVIMFLTGNTHKLREVSQIAPKYGVEVRQVKMPKIEVQSSDLGEVARRAIESLRILPNVPVFTEDAGLFIEALNGFPGPYSSYVYKTIGVRGLLKLMEGVINRRAYFESAIAVTAPGIGIRVFRRRVYGVIAEKPRGSGGFGFDPVFIPDGYTLTFAEMSTAEKNRISHRAKAFDAMCTWLKEQGVI